MWRLLPSSEAFAGDGSVLRSGAQDVSLDHFQWVNFWTTSFQMGTEAGCDSSPTCLITCSREEEEALCCLFYLRSVCQWQQGGVTSGRLLSQHFSSPTHSWRTLLPPPSVSILRATGTMGKVSGEGWRWSGEWWRLWCFLYGRCASTNHPKKCFNYTNVLYLKTA